MSSKRFGKDADLVSLAWIAQRTSLSPATVKRHLDEDGVPSFRFGKARNATIRYYREDIERWMQSCWLA